MRHFANRLESALKRVFMDDYDNDPTEISKHKRFDKYIILS